MVILSGYPIKAVLELIGDYPKYKIAQVLGISSSILKRWEHQFAPTLIENDFVEITDVDTPPIPETQLELQLQLEDLKLSVSGTCFELASFVKQLTLGK